MGALSNLRWDLDISAFAVQYTRWGSGPALGGLGESSHRELSDHAQHVLVDVGTSQTPTFSVFLKGNGPVPFDPGRNRAFVRFEDSAGVVRGTTSVAVRTQ